MLQRSSLGSRKPWSWGLGRLASLGLAWFAVWTSSLLAYGQHEKKRFRINLSEVSTAPYALAAPIPRWFGEEKGHASKEIIRLAYEQITENFTRLVGTIRLLERSSYLEQPPRDGIEIGTFDFTPWQKIGANGLLKIGFRVHDAQKIDVMLRFYDIDQNRMILRMDQATAPGQMRWLLHTFCNAIYQNLTGKPGIFTSLIAYVKSNPKGGKDIWVMDFDGANPRRVVSNGAINILPLWSSDGRSLYYTSYLEGRPYLYALHFPTRQIRRISQYRGNYTGGSMSPDGRHLAFSLSREKSDGSDIYLSKPDGSGLRRLTTAWGIDVSPSWSFDSQQIAFVSERFTDPQIFVMKADGSAQTRLTYRGDYNQEPRWSPAGPELLFTARDELLNYDLFVIKLETDPQGKTTPIYRRLTQNQGRNFEATWSPDGRFILFVSTRYGERKLFIMNSDGSHQRLFYRGRGDFESPAWSPVFPTSILPSGPAGYSFYKSTRLVPPSPLQDLDADTPSKATSSPASLPSPPSLLPPSRT